MKSIKIENVEIYVKAGGQLEYHIPTGMSGKQFKKWKKDHEIELQDLKTASILHVDQNNYMPREGKKFNMPSQTIPDQTMSLRVLLKRHANGLPISGNAETPSYDPEEISQGVNIKTLDISEIISMVEESKTLIETVRKNQQAAADRAKKEAEAHTNKLKEENDRLIELLKNRSKEEH